MSGIAAALDIGTNSTLFLLAYVDDRGTVRPLKHDVRTNDLGRGLDADRNLRPATIALNIALLKEFKRTAEAGGAVYIYAAATEALRRARNAGDLIERAHRELGMDIRVISGAEEAHLTYWGIRSGFPNSSAEIIAVDIGGGSSEIILGRGEDVLSAVSLPVGAVVLDQQYLRHDPPNPGEIESVQVAADGAFQQLPDALRKHSADMVICGGTASSLAAADLELTTYQPEKIAGHPLTQERVDHFVDQFSRMTLEQRRRIPGIGSRRAEIILPGAVLISRLLRHFRRDRYVTSERGLRYGLLVKAFRGDHF